MTAKYTSAFFSVQNEFLIISLMYKKLVGSCNYTKLADLGYVLLMHEIWLALHIKNLEIHVHGICLM